MSTFCPLNVKLLAPGFCQPLGKVVFMRVNDSATDELVQEFYGLDPKTMLVDSVSITKNGKIHRWTWEHGYIVKQMTAGKSMQAEVTRIFGLAYLVAVQPSASIDLRKQVIRGLETTATLLGRRKPSASL